MTRPSLFTALFAALALTAGVTQLQPALVEAAQNISAQGTGQDQHAHDQQQHSQANMQDMMKMHEQMIADMKAGNAKLDALVTDMNAASGNAKIDAVAMVVNELVLRHKAMLEHMGQMHQQMGGRGTMMQR